MSQVRAPDSDTELPAGTLTVAQVTNRVTAALAHKFPGPVWVAGEVLLSKRPATTRSLFFELVSRPGPNQTPNALIRAAVRPGDVDAFNAKLGQAGIVLADGLELRVAVQPQLWAASGSLSFTVSDVDAAFTVGRIALDRAALLAKLEAEGLLAAQQALSLPVMPLRIGLVTSNTSAAYADFVNHLRSSGIAWQVCAVDVRVQGTGAPEEITRALRALSKPLFPSWRPDVVVVCRGGGSRAELAAFDTETVARAIAGCPIPVICGVGHEIDLSVADAVAHRAVKTPTECAVILIDRVRRSQQHVERLWARTSTAGLARFDRALDGADGRLRRARTAAANLLGRAGEQMSHTDRRMRHAGAATTAAATERLCAAYERAARAGTQALDAEAHHLDAAATLIRAVDPEQVLARGYSITRTADGAAVCDPLALTPGTAIRTTLAAGTVDSRVTSACGRGAQDSTDNTHLLLERDHR